ncbi:hypothetical protein CPB84DRAFT_1960260 [Gymnopilus junonius]|uniref:Uncharacterized protein n=1 Tax=Gymnopilus junonius TaxID=109634 RepID=A0A9P5NT06_GYMJU|nr:hypothetical protein CPB84DRAFT_1960260 [Gymnopilus junonius]
MVMKPPENHPTIPQEIIDFVIDIIALEGLDLRNRHCEIVLWFQHGSRIDAGNTYSLKSSFEEGMAHGKGRRDSLRFYNQTSILYSASTPSRLFLFFSDRVQRLESAGILTILCMLSWKVMLNICRNLGRRRIYLLDVLELLTRSPLHKFAFEVRNGILHWSVVKGRALAIFSAIRSLPSLRSLSFVNVHDLDRSLVFGENIDRNQGLQELNLWDVSMMDDSDSIIPGTPAFNIAPQNWEELEYLGIRTPEEYIRILSLDSSSFPRLRTLVVGFPAFTSEVPEFFKIMNNFAPTLTTLEIHDIYATGFRPNGQLPSSLSDLYNLRKLTLCATYNRPRLLVYASLEMMAHLLESGTSSLPIEDISITLVLASIIANDVPHIHQEQNELLLQSAVALDQVLTSAKLVNLKRVAFTLKLTTNFSKHANFSTQDIHPIGIDSYIRHNLLPTTSTFPSIDLRDSIEIFS